MFLEMTLKLYFMKYLEFTVYPSLTDVCEVKMCYYVFNDNITHANLFKDGLHLLDSGKQFLAKNFVFNFYCK